MARHLGDDRSRSPRHRSPEHHRTLHRDRRDRDGMERDPVSPRSRGPFGSILDREHPHGPRSAMDYLGGPGGHGPANGRPEPYSRGRTQETSRYHGSHLHHSQAPLDKFDPNLPQPSVSHTSICLKKKLPCPWDPFDMKHNWQQPGHTLPKLAETHIDIPPLTHEPHRTQQHPRLPGIGHLLDLAASDLTKPDAIPQQQPSATPSPTSNKKYYCRDCKRWLRTKSELNKHYFKHIKPFHCDVSGCIRKEGFTTKNDLNRHKRSVHDDRSEDRTIYTCPIDQCALRIQPKLWPRADNFRDHLRRIHNKIYTVDDDLGEYVYRNPENPSPEFSSDPALPVRLEPVLTRTHHPHNSVLLPSSTSQVSENMRTVDAYLIDPSGSHA